MLMVLDICKTTFFAMKMLLREVGALWFGAFLGTEVYKLPLEEIK